MNSNRGINLSDIKMNNRSSILKILREKGSLPRKDIAKLSGLTPAAVTILTNEMISQNILIEKGFASENNKVGRKKVLIDINKEHKFIVGINIERETTSVGISDLNLNIVQEIEIITRNDISPEKFLSKLANEVMGMLWNLNIKKDDILGVGIGVIGDVNSFEGISNKAYGIWEKKVFIKDILQEKLEIPVVIENNVRALALAEIGSKEHSSIKNFLFIKYGPGLGSAIVINKKIYYGSHNNAGEIGHMVIDINGPKCKCGQRGCLEAYTSSDYLKKSIKNLFDRNRTPILWEKARGEINNIKAKYIYEEYNSGNPLIEEIIDETLFRMSFGLGNVIQLFDPEKIILYGNIFKSEKIRETICKKISKIIKTSVNDKYVDLSVYDPENKIIGSISVALQKLFYDTGGLTQILIKEEVVKSTI